MTNYVYIRSESNLWTVGFYAPDGKWHSESDHSSSVEAASRTIHLNGGNDEYLLRRIAVLEVQVSELRYKAGITDVDEVYEAASSNLLEAQPSA